MLCHCNDDLHKVRSLESDTIFIEHSTLGCSSVVTSYAGRLILSNSKTRVNTSVADPGGEGPCLPPGPVKISHKKDDRQRRLHKFHVSCPPLTRPLNLLLHIYHCPHH